MNIIRNEIRMVQSQSRVVARTMGPSSTRRALSSGHLRSRSSPKSDKDRDGGSSGNMAKKETGGVPGHAKQETMASNISNTISEINKDNFLSNPVEKLTDIFAKTGEADKSRTAKAVDRAAARVDPAGAQEGKPEDRTRNRNGLGVEDPIRLETFFDSYKVVQEFKKSGFTDEQSRLLMKYTYHVLEEKLNWLNQTYSPKVDLENEAYLFEAAHSELLFEVTNSREISLMNLTNAMIILKRGFNNLDDETIAQIKLNDDLIKMEINQFKHENNLHQRRLNLKNTDLNSRILSDMVSGLKSEVETFRWQLTRAGILSIMIMAVSIMAVWNVTKRLGADEDTDHRDMGPYLVPVHEQTDEESHDYEADWDERVTL